MSLLCRGDWIGPRDIPNPMKAFAAGRAEGKARKFLHFSPGTRQTLSTVFQIWNPISTVFSAISASRPHTIGVGSLGHSCASSRGLATAVAEEAMTSSCDAFAPQHPFSHTPPRPAGGLPQTGGPQLRRFGTDGLVIVHGPRVKTYSEIEAVDALRGNASAGEYFRRSTEWH
jgi:hypothetical protein